MKIRADFVTNSSSSSYVSVMINSSVLFDILKKYDKYLDSMTLSTDGVVQLFGDEMVSEIPAQVSEVVGRLVEFLEVIFAELDTNMYGLEEVESRSSNDEEFVSNLMEFDDITEEEARLALKHRKVYKELKAELEGNSDKILGSILEVFWENIDSGWGGDDCLRFEKSMYSEEDLEEIYKILRSRKNYDKRNIEEMFEEYVGGKTSRYTDYYRYKKDELDEYSYSFVVED